MDLIQELTKADAVSLCDKYGLVLPSDKKKIKDNYLKLLKGVKNDNIEGDIFNLYMHKKNKKKLDVTMRNDYPLLIKYKNSNKEGYLNRGSYSFLVSNVVINTMKWSSKIKVNTITGRSSNIVTIDVESVGELSKYMHERDYKVLDYLLKSTYKPYRTILENVLFSLPNHIPSPLVNIITDYAFY